MKQYTFVTHSSEETEQYGIKLASLLQAGDVIAFDGDLGAGKTTFTKGLAKGLGVAKVVNSPTFTIIKEYEGKLPLYHMDVYRLEESGEDLGFDEYFDGDGVTVVEWAKFIQPYLPDEYLLISIRRIDENVREFQLTPIGERYERICEEFVDS